MSDTKPIKSKFITFTYIFQGFCLALFAVALAFGVASVMAGEPRLSFFLNAGAGALWFVAASWWRTAERSYIATREILAERAS